MSQLVAFLFSLIDFALDRMAEIPADQLTQDDRDAITSKRHETMARLEGLAGDGA